MRYNVPAVPVKPTPRQLLAKQDGLSTKPIANSQRGKLAHALRKSKIDDAVGEASGMS